MKKVFSILIVAFAVTAMVACNKDNHNDTEDPDWVDLGLPSGLLWAKCNVGATTPEGYGDYFAWGETVSKDYYYRDTYIYYKDQGEGHFQLTKYCTDASYGYNGFVDSLTTLEPEDDAATVNLGNGTRTPTKEEWVELLNNVTAVWTTKNGVNGLRFTAANGKSIFLPASGTLFLDETIAEGSYGFYWSASLGKSIGEDKISPNLAWQLNFREDFSNDLLRLMHSYYRINGCNVRAVKSATK